MFQGCGLVLYVLVCDPQDSLETGSFFIIPILLMKKLRPRAMK